MISIMKIYTDKIKAVMRQKHLSLTDLGELYNPPQNRQAMWYVIHRGRNLNTINKLAEALDMDAKDLLKED